MQRGIILFPFDSNDVDRGDGAVRLGDCPLSESDIRYFLLYWDKMIKVVAGITQALPLEEDLYKNEALDTAHLQSYGEEDPETGSLIMTPRAAAMAPFVVGEHLYNDPKTEWVVQQMYDRLKIPTEFKTTMDCLRIRLYNCLPVPVENINVAEILEFKRERSDELSKLHSCVDDLYIEALNKPETKLAFLKATSELSSCIKDIQKVSNERFKLLKGYTLTFNFNMLFESLRNAAATGTVIKLFDLGQYLAPGTLIAGTTSLIYSAITKTDAYAGKVPRKNLHYLSQAYEKEILNKDNN